MCVQGREDDKQTNRRTRWFIGSGDACDTAEELSNNRSHA